MQTAALKKKKKFDNWASLRVSFFILHLYTHLNIFLNYSSNSFEQKSQIFSFQSVCTILFKKF